MVIREFGTEHEQHLIPVERTADPAHDARRIRYDTSG